VKKQFNLSKEQKGGKILASMSVPTKKKIVDERKQALGKKK